MFHLILSANLATLIWSNSVIFGVPYVLFPSEEVKEL